MSPRHQIYAMGRYLKIFTQFFLLYFSQQTMQHSFVIRHHLVSSNSQKQDSATKWTLVLALYRWLSSLPLRCRLPHVFFETAGTIVLLSFTILLPWTQKALSKISLHTLIRYFFSLSAHWPEDIRNLASHIQRGHKDLPHFEEV